MDGYLKIYSEEKKLQFFFSEVGNAIWKYVTRKKNFFAQRWAFVMGNFVGEKSSMIAEVGTAVTFLREKIFI